MKKILAFAALALMLPAASYAQMSSEANVGLSLGFATNDTGLYFLGDEKIDWGGGVGVGLNAEYLVKPCDSFYVGLGLEYTNLGEEEITIGYNKLETTVSSYGAFLASRLNLPIENNKFYVPFGVGYGKSKAENKVNGDKENYSDGGLTYYVGLGMAFEKWNLELRYSSYPKIDIENNKTKKLNTVNVLAKYRFSL